MSQNRAPAGAQEAAAQLDRLSDEFFEVVHTTDPFNATQLGVSGFDALVPDPSRDGTARGVRRLASIETRLEAIDASLLGEQDQVNHAVLARLAWGACSDLEHGLWEGNASGSRRGRGAPGRRPARGAPRQDPASRHPARHGPAAPPR